VNRPEIPKNAVLIDLAAEPDFAIGPLLVSPSLREVRAADRRETVEPRVMQVLIALVRADGAVVSRDTLIEHCWGGRIVGDDAINRCIAKVRSLAEFPGAPAFEIMTVPRVGYLLRPFTTAAEISPAELQRTADQDAHPEGRHAGRFALWAILAIFMIAAVGTAAYLNLYWDSPAKRSAVTTSLATKPVRIAVLPFDTFGAPEPVRAFGDAVVEQTIGVLNDNPSQTPSRIDGALLRVSDRNTAPAKLGADLVLDGSIRRDDAGFHLNVRLDHTPTNATLWTAVFDQSGRSGSSLKAQVAVQVADEIKTLRAAYKPGAGEIDDAALAAYLKAGDYERLPVDKSTLLHVMDLLRVVIARSPGFAPAYADLAVTSALLVSFATPQEAPRLRADTRKWADRALALNPHDGDSYWALALIVPDGHWAEKEAIYRKGLSVDPDHGDLNNYLGDLLASTGRLSESVVFQKRSLALDPLSPSKTAGLAWTLVGTGQCAEAIKTIEHANDLWPTLPQVWHTRLRVLAQCGRESDALSMLNAPERAPMPLEAEFLSAWRTYIEAIKAKSSKARVNAVNAILNACQNNRLGRTEAIGMLAALGSVDAAFDLANESFSASAGSRPQPLFDATVLFLKTSAAFRQDPRFMALAAKVELVAFWNATQRWPDFCVEPGASHDCRVQAAVPRQ
jgi:DNA-binding winged helix-turn-helix (wHTH) protein/TolB-like protein